MSLQEIERSHIQKSSTPGFAKQIDQSSEKMMLDILQITQYAYPISSCVRELSSNAVDSQFEKEIAIEILSGKAVPEDFFINREGEQYEASKWDPGYYSLDYLDTQNNTVILEYIEGEGVGFTDKFIVTDHGVGIGGPRLRGVFSLGYSTKRNTNKQLGAYGIGAKSGLATGTDYYIMETVHNGKLFRFNCFSYKVDSLVPQFDLEKNIQNQSKIPLLLLQLVPLIQKRIHSLNLEHSHLHQNQSQQMDHTQPTSLKKIMYNRTTCMAEIFNYFSGPFIRIPDHHPWKKKRTVMLINGHM